MKERSRISWLLHFSAILICKSSRKQQTVTSYNNVCTVQCDSEARSFNQCSNGRARSVTNSVCWRIKDQLDVTCYFISLLMCSTYFGHEYIHRQELATVLLNYHIGRNVLGSMCVGVSVWLGRSGIRVAGCFSLQHGYHSNPTTPKLQHTSKQEHTTNVVIQ